MLLPWGDIEIEQIASVEEIIYGSGNNFSDDDIDAGQIDIAEEASPEGTEYPESTRYTYYLKSKRLVDTAVCMEFTAEIILLFYANDCKLVHPMDVKPQLDIWKKCILDFVRESEFLSNNREPVDMFCAAIAEIARNDIHKIPPSKTLFEEKINYSIGYYDYSARTLYLKPRESYTEVVQYWSKQGIPFAVKENPLRQELLLSGMVRGSVDGDSRKTSTPIRINGKATRMLELDLIKFNNKYTAFALPPSPLIFP